MSKRNRTREIIIWSTAAASFQFTDGSIYREDSNGWIMDDDGCRTSLCHLLSYPKRYTCAVL